MFVLEWGVVLLAVVYHLVRCPYNKVEESFNTQAVHDALRYGVFGGVSKWDHVEFPGTVPRTFLGALAVAAASRCVEMVLPASRFVFQGLSGEEGCAAFQGGLERQTLARFVAACAWLAGFARFAAGTRKVFGGRSALWLAVATAAQFHQPFYASRLLPNSLATPVALAAYGDALVGRRYRALFLLVAATTALRCDLAAMVVPLGALWTFDVSDPRKLGVTRAVATSITAVLLAVSCSVVIDSHLWQRRWLWPEGAVLLYNNPVDNRSASWGVSPWHWYATSALPRALGATAFLVPLGVFLEPRRVGLDVVFPAFFSVALLSAIPHKELRFIFPALPSLTLAAAVAADRLSTPPRWLLLRRRGLRKKRDDDDDDDDLSDGDHRRRLLGIRKLVFAAIPAAACASTLAATVVVFAPAARANYPGGVALRRIQALYCDDPAPRSLHVDVAAATTGASRFGQEFDHWVYDKRENIADAVDYAAYDLRIAQLDPRDDADAESRRRYFTDLATVDGYAGLALATTWPFIVHRRTPALALLERRDDGGGPQS